MADRKARTRFSGDGMEPGSQGRIFFEKRMTSTSVSPPSAQLTLPIEFVRQHSDKIQKSVTLRNGADGRTWTVDIHLVFLPRLQALFQVGWKAFAVANALCVDDRVTFELVATSLFDVHILRSKGAQSKEPPPSRGKSPIDEPPNRCGMTKDEPEGDSHEKKETSCVPGATDSSQTASDMDLHFFEPMEQECVSEHLDVEMESCDQAQDQELPNFLKRLTRNVVTGSFQGLEIPSSFRKTHSARIGAGVIKLQGIEEGSPVYDVTVRRYSVRLSRWFLGTGWSKFASDNMLRTGQRLVFILIADSFFVVRNI